MDHLEQVNMCQNYIIVIKLHQDRSIITSKSQTGQNWAKFSAAEWKTGQNSLCTVPKSVCVVPLWGWFWGTSRSLNWAQVYLFEGLAYLLSNPNGISGFGCHFPLQNFNLPRLLPACQNRGCEVIFWVFLTSWGLKTCPNFFSMHQKPWFFMKNPEI